MLRMQTSRSSRLTDLNEFEQNVYLSNSKLEHTTDESGRPAERPGAVEQDEIPTQLFTQETKLYRTLKTNEEISL